MELLLKWPQIAPNEVVLKQIADYIGSELPS